MLPPGYQIHPNDPRYCYNPATGHVMEVPPAPPSPPVPSTSSVPPGGYQPSFDALDRERERIKAEQDKSRGDVVWINFPKLDPRPGSEVSLEIRLLPAWGPDIQQTWVRAQRFRIRGSDLPENKFKKEWVYVDSFDSEGGPGECPLMALYQELRSASDEQGARDLRPERIAYWQALNMSAPQEHWVQAKDANGNPVLVDGYPSTQLVPGILRVKASLHDKMVALMYRLRAWPSDVENGFNLGLFKKKTGPQQFDVEYDVLHRDKSPVDPAMRPVLDRLVNLPEKVLHFRSREEMDAIADNLRRKYGLGGASVSVALPPTHGGWMPHPQMPGYEMNPATGALRPIGGAPAPHSPPVPTPAPAPAPVAAPPVPPPVPAAAPPPPLPNLPPPTAPGVPAVPPLPAAPAVPAPTPAPVVAAIPPAPPPPPGMPPSAPAGLSSMDLRGAFDDDEAV